MKQNILSSCAAILALVCPAMAMADFPMPPALTGPDGIIAGHEYVDLGLPSGTLWAICNLGASSPYEAGDFYAWGEVEPRSRFTWDDYPFTIGIFRNPATGVSWYELEDIGDNICGTEYDAARHQWGNAWRLPNREELYELRMHCWNKWTTENGINGIRVYGPNAHSIFLPAGGELFYDYPDMAGIWGYCWSGVANTEETDFDGTPITPGNCAYAIQIDSGGLQNNDRCAKAGGNNVRPVINRKEAGMDYAVTAAPALLIRYCDGVMHVTGGGADGAITVYDASGRKVAGGPVENGTFSISELSQGVYIVSYSDRNNQSVIRKIIVP